LEFSQLYFVLEISERVDISKKTNIEKLYKKLDLNDDENE